MRVRVRVCVPENGGWFGVGGVVWWRWWRLMRAVVVSLSRTVQEFVHLRVRQRGQRERPVQIIDVHLPAERDRERL